MKTINVLALRRRLGSTLDEVVRESRPIAVTRQGQPLVVLVPADTYQEGGAGDTARPRRLMRAAERVDVGRRRHAARLRDLDPVQLVRETRALR
ncbi:MAG: type II toxin-antitoxin system Phd/YefM family antitoxin [Gemmatimonadales bacterium]